ncbi:MAG: hypothetical protein Q9224_001756 [Gallowayella concinna]
MGRSLPILLVARLLEGLSTAIVTTLGMALLNDVVGAEHIGQAMGYTSMALSTGLLLGPVLGGVLYEYGGYSQVFYPAFGLITVEMMLRLMVIEEKPSPSSPRATRGANGTGRESSNKLKVSDTEPLLDQPRMFRNAFTVLLVSPRFLVALLGTFVLMSIGSGFDGVLAPYIKDEFDLKAIHVAALFLALALPMFLAPVSGALTDRHGAKWPVAGGFVVAIPSLISLRLVTAGTSDPFLKLLVLLFIVGIALAFTVSPLSAEASKIVKQLEQDNPGVFGPHGAYSQGFGLMSTASAAGGLAGPLYTGFVRIWLGWSAMSLSLGLVCSLMLIPVIMFCGGKPFLGESRVGKPDVSASSEVS